MRTKTGKEAGSYFSLCASGSLLNALTPFPASTSAAGLVRHVRARFLLAQIHCAPAPLKEIDRILKLDDEVLRSFVFKDTQRPVLEEDDEVVEEQKDQQQAASSTE